MAVEQAVHVANVTLSVCIVRKVSLVRLAIFVASITYNSTKIATYPTVVSELSHHDYAHADLARIAECRQYFQTLLQGIQAHMCLLRNDTETHEITADVGPASSIKHISILSIYYSHNSSLSGVRNYVVETRGLVFGPGWCSSSLRTDPKKRFLYPEIYIFMIVPHSCRA